MLTKKRKLSAMALICAMLLTSVSPVTAHAEDAVVTSTHNHGTLTVTADLMDDKDVVTLENLNWDKIVIPGDLGAKKVVLKNVITAELVIESDTSCEIEIFGGAIAKLEVAASQVKDFDLRDLAELIAGGMSKSKAQEAYYKNKKEAKELKKQVPVVTLKNNAVVAVIEVAGNAKLSLKDGKVDKLQVVSEHAENLKVTVDSFEGILAVDQNSKSFAVVELELKNSKPSKAEVSSNGKGSIVLSGTDSVIADAVVDGSASLVLNVETKKLETAKDSKNVELVVLAPVEEVVVNGEATDVNVTSDVVVKKAVINGANATVTGEGKVESAAVSSDSADVTTEGTEVYDPAKVTATPKPTTKPTSAPSYSGGSSGGSSGGGSWYPTYPTYAPRPTATPTPRPITPVVTPAVTPGAGEEEEVHQHTWNVEAATCGTAKQCTDETCGYVEESATGLHTWEETGIVTAPTCTEAGYTTYKCLYCTETKQDDITGSAGHSVVEWTIGELVEGETCVYTQVGTCTISGCGETVISETTVEKHNSELTVSINKAATCQTVGIKAYSCPDCNKEVSTEEYSNAEAHAWEESAETPDSYSCTVDGCTATKTVIVMTEDGVSSETLSATTEVAMDGNVVMSLDNAVIQQVKQLEENAAASGSALKLSAKELDEAERTAAKEKLQSVADKEQLGDAAIFDLNMTVNDEPVSNFSGKVTVRLPYELEEGEDPESVVVWYLTDDGEVKNVQGKYHEGYVSFETNHFSYYTVVRMTPEQRCTLFGHIMLSATTNPTCTEDGYITSICQRCGETEITPGAKATGHNITIEVVEEATCQHKGKHRHECNNKHCEFYTEVETPKGNHKPKENGNKKDATCLEAGYIEYKCDCGDCDYFKKEEIKALGHKRGDNGKCTVCGAKVDCEHAWRTLTLVELAKGAKTCEDGVVVSEYCVECGAVIDEKTTKEHTVGTIDFINLFDYGTECGGYISKGGCACGEETGGISYNLINFNAWDRTEEYPDDVTGAWHAISYYTYDNIRMVCDSIQTHIEGCTYNYDQTYKVYVDNKLIKELSAVYDMDSHREDCKVKLAENSKTCADGVELTVYCLDCGVEVRSFTATGEHRYGVVKAFDISEYSKDACGGKIIYYTCACGMNSYINDWNYSSCSFNLEQRGNTVDGVYYETATYTCTKCGFKFTDTHTFNPLGNCRATRIGTLSFYNGDTVAETYDYSYEQNYHNKTYTVVELVNEGSKSCLDGVNVEFYCYECGEKTGWTTAATHWHGTDKTIDLSQYDNCCGGTISFNSCACGEEHGMSLPYDSHNLTYNWSREVGADGMEYEVWTANCQNCDFKYTQQLANAVGENCTAMQTNNYKFYIGENLIDTYSYTQEIEYHDTYFVDVTLKTEGASCMEGVTATKKCRNCDYSYTGDWADGHICELIEEVDLSEYGSECGGTLIVQLCPCGEANNTQLKLECDYGYSWDYILWQNYNWIEETDDMEILRAEYSCSVTDPSCDFKFAMEQQIELEVADCRRDGTTYFCLDKDGDGVYESKYPVLNFWNITHSLSGESVEAFSTAEDGTRLRTVTRSCTDCGEYKRIETYADYLGTDTYDYQIETAWGIEGEMEYETWNYTFAADCCSYTRSRSNDGGYLEVMETRPGCITDSVLNYVDCAQYATGVCKKCGHENALNLRHHGQPQTHTFTYNSTTGMYECSRCGLENEKGVNGSITLRDVSDDTAYIAAYWNGSQTLGNNEVVFSVYVFLCPVDAEAVMTDLEVTDTKIFDTGKVSLSKTDVAEWAAANNVTADYDVMFSFIPKNASENDAFNIIFTEE